MQRQWSHSISNSSSDFRKVSAVSLGASFRVHGCLNSQVWKYILGSKPVTFPKRGPFGVFDHAWQPAYTEVLVARDQEAKRYFQLQIRYLAFKEQ